MTVNLDRLAACTLASYLSPIAYAHVDDLILDMGLKADEINEAVNYLERCGVRVFDSSEGYKASIATWQRCQRFGLRAC